MKKYKVQLIQTYAFEYEVEAENRVQAEVKAREIYKNSDYKNGDDFFALRLCHMQRMFLKLCPLKKDVNNMTNLDKIRTMPPEELGVFLSNLTTIEDCFECPIRDVCNERMVNPNNEAFHTCELSFYHWLQREYKPGYFENQ